tara:strand:- start:36 stop:335 length:300 start_codon:yes stop_codon:yes gene_type:complete
MNLQATTLVFKLGEDNNFSDLKITSEIKHFIADLRGITPELAENIKDKFTIFAESISKMNGSFVIVCEFSFEEELTIVPTIQEAYDYIEMDEMQRQLEL